jgi:hypothetical protein
MTGAVLVGTGVVDPEDLPCAEAGQDYGPADADERKQVGVVLRGKEWVSVHRDSMKAK